MSTNFLLQRQLGYYVLQEFIPTILIVALSWVGFWIDERSVPARVSLGITTVLAITTLMFGIQSSLPRVGHVKAIDVYLLGNFLFVFAALVEFAFICSCTKVFLLNTMKCLKKNHSTRLWVRLRMRHSREEIKRKRVVRRLGSYNESWTKPNRTRFR